MTIGRCRPPAAARISLGEEGVDFLEARPSPIEGASCAGHRQLRHEVQLAAPAAIHRVLTEDAGDRTDPVVEANRGSAPPHPPRSERSRGTGSPPPPPLDRPLPRRLRACRRWLPAAPQREHDVERARERDRRRPRDHRRRRGGRGAGRRARERRSNRRAVLRGRRGRADRGAGGSVEPQQDVAMARTNSTGARTTHRW